MRNLEKGFYGSVAMGDPMSSFVERDFVVSYDFGKKAVPASKVIPLMALPKGFVIDRISVVQTKPTNGAKNVTFARASEDSATIGTTFALAGEGDNLLRSSQSASSFVQADDILCLVAPAAEINAGKIELCVHGIEVFAEGDAAGVNIGGVDIENYRASLQTEGDEDANCSDPTGGQWPLD